MKSLFMKTNSKLRSRSNRRRKKIVAHRAKSFVDAENWDLEFWQSCTPQQRLSALIDIQRDVRLAQQKDNNG